MIQRFVLAENKEDVSLEVTEAEGSWDAIVVNTNPRVESDYGTQEEAEKALGDLRRYYNKSLDEIQKEHLATMEGQRRESQRAYFEKIREDQLKFHNKMRERLKTVKVMVCSISMEIEEV